MLKFFRKYNTVILVFGGVFLMIAFLLPQAIQQFSPNAFNRKLFKIGETTYGQSEVDKATRQMAVLENTFDPMLGMRGITMQAVGSESVEHYLMLTEMARRTGLYNPGGRVDTLLPELAQTLSGVPPSETMIGQIETFYRDAVGRAGDPEIGAEALRRFDAILRLNRLYVGTNMLSEPELALYASRMFDRVTADVGMIPGSAYAQANLDPLTEEELRAHYRAYRNDRPADNPYGFGYRLDDAAKFEVLLLDRSAIEGQVEIEALDLRKYHRRNKESRGYADDFRVARSQVERDLRNERVDEIIETIEGAVDNLIVSAHAPLERTDNGLLELPEDWASRRPTMESLRDAANEAANRILPLEEPVARILTRTDDWMTREDIAADPEIRTLSIARQGRRVSLANAIMLFPEFVEENPIPAAQAGVVLPGVTGERGVGRPGDAGFLRVLETRPEGPSESIEQVRAEVEADATALRGYEALTERASEIRERAFESGLFAEGVYEVLEQGALVATDARIEYFNRGTRGQAANFFSGAENPDIRAALNNERFARDVIERVTGFDPTLEIDQVSEEARFFVVEAPQSQALTLVYITGRTPVTTEVMRQVRATAGSFLTRRIDEENPDLALRSSLSRRSLARRLGYTHFDQTHALPAAGEDGVDAPGGG